MAKAIERFLGDTPFRVAIKLLVLSLVVGFVMRFLGWMPQDVLRGVINFFRNLWELGFEAIFASLDYLIVGAAIVVPAFLIIRLFRYRSGPRD